MRLIKVLYFFLVVLILNLTGCAAQPQSIAPNAQQPAQVEKLQPSQNTEQPQPSQKTVTEPAQPIIKIFPGKVTKVVDGDTAYILINGKEEKVRFIGVDTPETKHPSQPVEPYGPEASSFTTKQLTGKQVYLETDVTERDKYGRLLAYIWLEKPQEINDSQIRAKMFNAHLLLNGYAQLLTIPPNVKYTDYFTKYQTEARNADKGLWGIKVNNTTSPPPKIETPIYTPKPQPTKPKELTVFVTRTGEKYHLAGCRYLRKSQIPMSLSEAKNSGYEPCSVCGPPY